MSPALDIRNLALTVGSRQVLKNINLLIEPGEFGVLLGANGAGKTSLFTAICGLYHFSHGDIAMFGHPQRGSNSELMAKVGVVFQQSSLDLDLSVEQNLRYALSLYGLRGKPLQPKLERALKAHDLWAQRKQAVRKLNGGHRRRLELIRATVHEPELLLLDEATVGLDPAAREAFVRDVRRLCHEQQTAVLWSTHLIDEAQASDRVFILHEGCIQTQASAQALMQRYQASSLAEVFRQVTAPAGNDTKQLDARST